MPSAAVSTEIPAAASAVWERVGDFTSWHRWIPRIVSTEMDAGDEAGPVGAVRTLTLSDGSITRERLAAKDVARRSLAYEFPDGSRFTVDFGVENYLAQVQIEEISSTRTAVHWSSEFDAPEAVVARMQATFAAIYTTFLENLADSLNADALDAG